MSKQRLHPSLAEIDVATGDDVHHAMSHAFTDHLRDQWRTIKLMKLPVIRATATSATVNLGQGSGYADQPGAQVGPEQGFIWMLRRVIVASNTAADTAKYTLYSGSDPTLYDSGHLLEGFTAGSAGQGVGIGYYPGTDAAWLFNSEQIYAQVLGATNGNQYVMSGIAIEVASERLGALIGLYPAWTPWPGHGRSGYD